MTPEQRARAWYPNASSGGGNNMPNYNSVGHKFLWKPRGDKNPNCAVHTPHGLRINSLTVGGKTYTAGSYGNGWRPLFRLDKPGSAYGKGVSVQINLHGGGLLYIVVPDGGKRFEKNFPKPEESSPVQPVTPTAPAPSKPAGGSITFPPSYADRVALVALVGGKGELCARDPQKPGRWTHKRSLEPRDFYAIRWAEKPPAYVKAFDLGPVGLWSYFDDGDFQSWPNKQVPVSPVPPPATPSPAPKPAPAEPAKDATLTATGLRLAPDLAPLVYKVLILTHAETPSKTVKYQCGFVGGEWSTGMALSSYPSAVYQIFWANEPPKRVPHHQGFPGAIKNVSHVMPDGRWNPPTTRNP